MSKETKLKVRAKTFLVLEGVTHHPGEVFELPEREALGLIGTGDAEQIPQGAPDKSEEGTAEQVAEAEHVASGEKEDPQKAKQLEDAAKKHSRKKE